MATVTITIGRLMEFDPKMDTITAYVERVTLYFQVEDVAEENKSPCFKCLIGPKTYALLRSLVTPAIPKEEMFAQLVEVLKKHFEPRPLVIAKCFNFHRQSQRTGESAKDFTAEL